MKAYIQTKRLTLREFCETDAQSMFDSYCHSEQATRYLDWYPHESVEETKIFLHNTGLASIEESNSLELAITLHHKDEVIGSLSVVNQFEDYIAEIGYVLGEKYWNQGYMSEALQAFINELFNQTPILKVRAIHDKDNQASGRVMEKCGLLKVGKVWHQKKYDQLEMRECICYELTRLQWEKQRNE